MKPYIDVLYKHINTDYFKEMIKNELPTTKFAGMPFLKMKMLTIMPQKLESMVVKFQIQEGTFYKAIGNYFRY